MAEYIDKQAFNDAIREAVRKCPNSFYNGLEVARQIAHDMDAADVFPVRHGRWVKTIGENGVTSACHCNLCGFEDNRYLLFNYCPNCGAKMDGEA